MTEPKVRTLKTGLVLACPADAWTVKHIAEACGVSIKTVRNVHKRFGVVGVDGRKLQHPKPPKANHVATQYNLSPSHFRHHSLALFLEKPEDIRLRYAMIYKGGKKP